MSMDSFNVHQTMSGTKQGKTDRCACLLVVQVIIDGEKLSGNNFKTQKKEGFFFFYLSCMVLLLSTLSRGFVMLTNTNHFSKSEQKKSWGQSHWWLLTMFIWHRTSLTH